MGNALIPTDSAPMGPRLEKDFETRYLSNNGNRFLYVHPAHHHVFLHVHHVVWHHVCGHPRERFATNQNQTSELNDYLARLKLNCLRRPSLNHPSMIAKIS